MKLGIVYIAIGSAILIGGIVIIIMNLIMGDTARAVMMALYAGIAGSLLLYDGIKRLKKAKKQEAIADAN